MNQTERLQAVATIMAGMLSDPGRSGSWSEYAYEAWGHLSALEAAAPEPSPAPERVEPTDEEWEKAYVSHGIVETGDDCKNVSTRAYRLAALRGQTRS